MFTTGSKLLIGSAGAAWVFALVYGIAQGGTLGSLGLVSAAVALSLLAGLNLFVRDSNVSPLEPEAFDASPAAQATARPSLWPLLVALGATTMTLGLVTSRTIFVVGLIALVAGTLEWLVAGWSERASGERGFNAAARDVMIHPLELPVAAAIAGAVVVYSFSRVMLGLPSKSATVIAFAVVAAALLGLGTIVGLRPELSKATITGALSVVVVALIAAGAFAGLKGERHIESHLTTGDLAAKDECTAEETEADHDASQTVASKSNVGAEIVFENDELVADVSGFGGDFDALTVVRSNPTNVLFHNESHHHARLVLDLHPALDGDGQPVGPERVCTALVDPGGTQLLTVVINRPSIAVDGGFAFVVPGSDAELKVVVP